MTSRYLLELSDHAQHAMRSCIPLSLIGDTGERGVLVIALGLLPIVTRHVINHCKHKALAGVGAMACARIFMCYFVRV